MYTSPFFKEFPEIKEKNKGKFTAWAKENGFKDACSAANAVMKSKDKYSQKDQVRQVVMIILILKY
jgi:hypothetical protein